MFDGSCASYVDYSFNFFHGDIVQGSSFRSRVLTEAETLFLLIKSHKKSRLCVSNNNGEVFLRGQEVDVFLLRAANS